jgi:glutamyl-tRNA synthetase
MAGLKQRAKTLVELADSAGLYVRTRPMTLDDKAKAVLAEDGKPVIQAALSAFAAVPEWTGPALEAWVKGYAEQTGQKMGKVAQPLRAALAGTTVSPSIFEVMEALGKDETLGRLQDALAA